MKRIIAASLFFVAFFANAPHTNNTREETYQLSSEDFDQIECLAENIYFEARGESVEGQVAVAMVILNRAHVGSFGSDVCSIVYKKKGKICQFSWVCDKKISRKKSEESAYQLARAVAIFAVLNYNEDITSCATFYHAGGDKVRRKIGVSNLKLTTKIGKHTFYKKESLSCSKKPANALNFLQKA
jgi:spore germination cell wall hydrolase CwlJ-like protein